LHCRNPAGPDADGKSFPSVLENLFLFSLCKNIIIIPRLAMPTCPRRLSAPAKLDSHSSHPGLQRRLVFHSYLIIICRIGRQIQKTNLAIIIFSIPLLAYPVTIIANSVRIIAGAYITNWTRAALPENFWPSIHLAVGITVFLTFLTICYLLIAWRLNNAARI